MKARLRGWPRERAALEAVLRALPELAEEEGDGFFSGLTELLFHLTVPARPGYRGLELHTPLARYGGSYRYLFVLGMAEGLTPAPVAEDPSWASPSAIGSGSWAYPWRRRRRRRPGKPWSSLPFWGAWRRGGRWSSPILDLVTLAKRGRFPALPLSFFHGEWGLLIRTPYLIHSYPVSRVMPPTPLPKASSRASRGVRYPSPECNRFWW